MKQLGFITSLADLDRVAAPDAGGVLAVPALGGLGTLVAARRQSPRQRYDALHHRRPPCCRDPAGGRRPDRRTRLDRCGGYRAAAVPAAGRRQPHRLHDPDAGSRRPHAARRRGPPNSSHGRPRRRGSRRIAVNPALSLSEAIRVPEPSTVFTPRWSSDQAIESAAAGPKQPRRRDAVTGGVPQTPSAGSWRNDESVAVHAALFGRRCHVRTSRRSSGVERSRPASSRMRSRSCGNDEARALPCRCRLCSARSTSSFCPPQHGPRHGLSARRSPGPVRPVWHGSVARIGRDITHAGD